MKIVFTGGGTGGHFYPVIAIAEAIHDIVRERRLVMPQLYFLAPEPLDQKALFENSIVYVKVPAGKIRRYISLQNLMSGFTTLVGFFSALSILFRLYPDVIVSKGGYGSIPNVLAAWILRIPIVIHESDAKPGRANLLAARFATKIAISFESAAAYFPENTRGKIARTGIPVRKALTRVESEGARQYLGLETGIPTILILGGSQGSIKINESILFSLPDIVSFANVIHQTGLAHFKSVGSIAKVVLAGSSHADRYHPFNYFSEISLQRAAGIADVVVSRAGSGAIAEIALWKKPAILIPIPESVSHDQRTNAYAYARTGAAIVLEEGNLTPHILGSEIRRIASDPELGKRMVAGAAGFTDPDAARILAEAVLAIALAHDS
ncbi:UDP-N-acetylglucosamine--N-acetylmuramyl-(pentapeptide) pyrophosphoryl-undecaprenol N-acetylglucosamine transferase [Patescibacteria group bacterium]|nr:UDP-N-acetylglucosamine--N-acetylmuramyl-(pentapeptide) pyrophosphoryl-undecaprenol N-acetylglucosamine transferase [Patescibacteria group bacterium]